MLAEADAAFLEVASLQRRLAETDSALAEAELQLDAARTEAHRLERENHELRQILIALERGDAPRDAPAGSGDDSQRAELSFTAECSTSVLPAKVRGPAQRIPTAINARILAISNRLSRARTQELSPWSSQLLQLPAKVRVRDGVLEVSLVAAIPCVSVLQIFRQEGGEVAPVALRSFSTLGTSRPNSAGQSREQARLSYGDLPSHAS